MERFQLRLKDGQSLEDVLSELEGKLLAGLPREAALSDLSPHERERLGARLRSVLSRFIARYDTCGLQALCEEGLEPAPWNAAPRPELGPKRPWQEGEVTRLLLVVEKSPEELADALEAALFIELFRTPERAPRAKAARPALGAAIRSVLGPYLYSNVVCGQSELCREAVELDPWR